eukprot:scaffold647_cov150-Skeletonema_menzelii.AAC.4
MIDTNKNVVTSDSSTSAETAQTCQHVVSPFLANPRECHGYPPSYVKNEPKNELNFFFTNHSDQIQQDEGAKKKRGGIFKKMPACNLRKKGKTKKCVETLNKCVETERSLACSLVSREEISFEQLENQVSSSSKENFITKPVIIICHGAMSWRNQMLLINLSSELFTCLDANILRFDFTGNGQSEGEWAMCNFNEEYEDLLTVIDFVTNSLGCQVGCVIGHSKGTASVLSYASHVAKQELEDGKDVICKCFVNLAGRYRVPGIHDPLRKFGEEQRKEMLEKGFFEVKSAWGDGRVFKVTKEDLDAHKFQSVADTPKVLVHLKKDSSVRVLTIHGDDDEVVPVQDAFRFNEEIVNHSLHVIKQANHNFNGIKHIDEMVSQIVTFYNSVYNS